MSPGSVAALAEAAIVVGVASTEMVAASVPPKNGRLFTPSSPKPLTLTAFVCAMSAPTIPSSDVW